MANVEPFISRNQKSILKDDRVYVCGTPSGLRMQSHFGAVVDNDHSSGLCVVHLDLDAYCYCDDSWLSEIVEAPDNLIVLPSVNQLALKEAEEEMRRNEIMEDGTTVSNQILVNHPDISESEAMEHAYESIQAACVLGLDFVLTKVYDPETNTNVWEFSLVNVIMMGKEDETDDAVEEGQEGEEGQVT